MAVTKTIPLEQIIQIAEFRSRLRAFLRHNEQVARRCGLTPQRYELLLAIKGAPDGAQRLSVTELAQRDPALPQHDHRALRPRRRGGSNRAYAVARRPTRRLSCT